MRRILFVFSLIITASDLAQASSGHVGITLRVPEIRFISFGNSDRFVQVLADPTMGETEHVSLQVMAGPTRTVSLVSRSNTSYRLRVKLHGSADLPLQQPIRVRIKTV